ncbi:MAG: hypothetical protein MJZ58_01175 [Paludibacteraceae bacterium]|nr:hypothetical protein [Paludibacteraceae bacterium]
MKNVINVPSWLKINRALMAKKNLFLTIVFCCLLPLSLVAQSNITEPGASDPNQLYTTTYDNPTGPNKAGANGGPNKIGENFGGNSGADAGYVDPGSPVGAPWALLAFAAAYGAYATFRLVRRKRD